MSIDMNLKKLTKNAFRVTKHRNKTALRIRVPGGHLNVKFLPLIQDIADKYGNGSVHLTTRQGFEIPDIDFDKVDEINKLIEPILKGMEIENGVQIEKTDEGYPAAGTRNISSCIGNRVCPFANFDTSSLAVKIEKNIYPNNYHVKIAITGCPNDCIKAHMQDIGIIGTAQPQYDIDRCINCDACVKNCKSRISEALTSKNGKVIRDERRCIGCGECIGKCPTSAWTRNPKKYYRLIIMGRTGKKNPRIARTFMEWVDEETVLAVIMNTYKFVEKHIDTTLPKEHIGYIVDRVGFPEYRRMALDGIKLNPEAKVAKQMTWGGYQYEKDTFMK